ncbi:hypothetical protein FRACYDRAFT_248267 [Fragilariopsis cylindrus CCMP1102]|uniref:Uncharacterized protein n=1 Tax=Fragilariopsis cylindrus CCMP1102 TaxID=635003 RepID=A0A1E7ETR6_9STRA|nr:hypothetical protein FRACYDRAFT_248267 [Fragilariopsis cylindrus CCMP1102]|eukprot:OEU09418.1 hypothetical protein FRACYDRAFT_248267 [Fragilariopsis cylindrus CCMP1102]
MELSIEPCENNNNSTVVVDSGVKSLGPAYFSKPPRIIVSSTTTRNTAINNNGNRNVDIDVDDADNKKMDCGDCDGNNDDKKDNNKSTFDPTMCKVELTLYTAKLPERGMTTPVKKANRRNPSEIDDQTKDTASDEAIVIAVIDGTSFQVDLNRMQSITSTNQKGEMSVSSRGDTNSTIKTMINSTSRRDDAITLDLVHKKLKILLASDYVRPFPLSYSGLIASLDQKNNNSNNNNNDDDNDILECARMCNQSYSKSWNNFISFGDVLQKPVVRSEQQCSTTASSMMDSIRENDFKETINQFMQTIPKQVCSSFIEADQRAAALNLYDEKIGQQNVAFDDIIREYWPKNSISSNKRRRVESQHNSNNNVDYTGQFADILKEHKKLLKSKHELFLLPLRE